jgi:hypothetical protein
MLSRQARLRSAALTIALAAPAVAAHAQTPPVGHDTAGRSLHLRAGGGIDAAKDQYITAANALVGVEWQPRGSRFSLRMDGDYYRRTYNYDQQLAQPPGRCDVILCTKSVVLQIPGVSLDGRFDLMTTRLRPYVVSGVSLNRVVSDAESNRRCDSFSCAITPGEFNVSRSTNMTLGLHSGLGLSYQAGRSQLFAEFRLQRLTIGGYRDEYKPMTFGIRF